MTWLTEDPWPVIWIGGAALLALAVAYYNSRQKLLLAALLVVALIAGGLLIAERMIVTEREELEQTLHDAAAAVRANNLQAVLATIAPEAVEMRSTVSAILPQWQILDAKVTGGLKTEIKHSGNASTATASFIGRIKVKSPTPGQLLTHDEFIRPFTVKFRKEGDRWLMTEYETDIIPPNRPR